MSPSTLWLNRMSSCLGWQRAGNAERHRHDKHGNSERGEFDQRRADYDWRLKTHGWNLTSLSVCLSLSVLSVCLGGGVFMKPCLSKVIHEETAVPQMFPDKDKEIKLTPFPSKWNNRRRRSSCHPAAMCTVCLDRRRLCFILPSSSGCRSILMQSSQSAKGNMMFGCRLHPPPHPTTPHSSAPMLCYFESPREANLTLM